MANSVESVGTLFSYSNRHEHGGFGVQNIIFIVRMYE